MRCCTASAASPAGLSTCCRARRSTSERTTTYIADVNARPTAIAATPARALRALSVRVRVIAAPSSGRARACAVASSTANPRTRAARSRRRSRAASRANRGHRSSWHRSPPGWVRADQRPARVAPARRLSVLWPRSPTSPKSSALRRSAGPHPGSTRRGRPGSRSGWIPNRRARSWSASPPGEPGPGIGRSRVRTGCRRRSVGLRPSGGRRRRRHGRRRARRSHGEDRGQVDGQQRLQTVAETQRGDGGRQWAARWPEPRTRRSTIRSSSRQNACSSARPCVDETSTKS